eukprot:PhM_4_TR17372/c4_g2_i1/m.73076
MSVPIDHTDKTTYHAFLKALWRLETLPAITHRQDHQVFGRLLKELELKPTDVADVDRLRLCVVQALSDVLPGLADVVPHNRSPLASVTCSSGGARTRPQRKLYAWSSAPISLTDFTRGCSQTRSLARIRARHLQLSPRCSTKCCPWRRTSR